MEVRRERKQERKQGEEAGGGSRRAERGEVSSFASYTQPFAAHPTLWIPPHHLPPTPPRGVRASPTCQAILLGGHVCGTSARCLQHVPSLLQPARREGRRRRRRGWRRGPRRESRWRGGHGWADRADAVVGL